MQTARVTISSQSSLPPEELEQLTRTLQQDLLETDVERVEQVRAAASKPGAKGDPITLGALLVTLSASGGVLTTFITAVQSWLSHHEEKSVTLEIGGDKLTMTGVSSADQKRLIDQWLKRQGKR